ncbi:MAG TPA: outer membrane protein assembly factor BamA [Bacteroidia bacterium]
MGCLKKKLFIFFVILSPLFWRGGGGEVLAQVVIGGDSIDYANPKEYNIADVEIEGVTTLDVKVLKLVSGLIAGQRVKVPGEKFSEGIKNLWKQNFFDDIQINVDKIIGKDIFLKIILVEKPRLSRYAFRGISKKTEGDEIRKKIHLITGKIVTDQLLSSTKNIVKEYYKDKGYYGAKVDMITEEDKSSKNKVTVYINVDKGNKVRVEEVTFHGNTIVKTGGFSLKGGWGLRHYLKDTKAYHWYTAWNSGKYLEDNLEKDKPKIIDKYLSLGYRDAHIAKDTVYFVSPDRVKIDITIDEGHKYYFHNITWAGNSKYRSGQLDTILGIKKGDVFNQSVLDQKLNSNPNGMDISSLYMDDGYLFFQLTPSEVNVQNDSIDLEIRLYEGKPAIINRVTVSGNTKTNDHVIMRELRTMPGQIFRRSDIMRTQRQLQQLGYFDAAKMGVEPKPNPADGTVDIEYTVAEKPNDQIELSGGYGSGRIIGTLGVRFNNFSARNFFKKEAWNPLPSGDGQMFSIRAQSSGINYQSYNMSFTEPWLGGKKPNSLTVGAYYTVQNYNGQTRTINVNGVKEVNTHASYMTSMTGNVSFGKRLKWPDDYFSFFISPSYSYYTLYNATVFSFPTGYINNFKTKINISRNSLQGNPIFPTGGSVVAFTSDITPPYSLLNGKNYSGLTAEAKFRFLEFQKYKFTTAWYMQLTNQKAPDGKEARNLILKTSFGFGILGYYNPSVGVAPFERFYMGGSGLTGYSLDGREIIALRGYADNSISGPNGKGCAIISKYTMELRYPISLNPQATIFALAFAEAGNAEQIYKNFNPFDVKRSAGVGVRIFLPMFGLLGLDYGWGFDKIPYNASTGMGKGQFHFTIGANLGEL